MEFTMPTTEQAHWGLRAMKTVALADGGIDESERHMLEAVQRVFGTHHNVDGLQPLAPEELAAGLPDQQIRRQLVNGLIVMSLIDQDVKRAEAELVERFASALQVTLPEVTNLRHVVKKELFHLRLDLVRRSMIAPLFRQMPTGRQSEFGTRQHPALPRKKWRELWQKNRWFTAMV
ncbi:MAG TPA: hypothetical protein PKL51_10835 [Nitrospira sp.]|nr:hypothetical protein [Nitrospira sp.]